MGDILVWYGGAVKALGDGKVGGYLVRFSGPEEPDTEGDFFTAETDFGQEFPARSAVYYNHGLDESLKRRRLGYGDMKTNDVGVWVETQLNLRDEWEQAVYELAAAGKLGWSSGTAVHLVEREQVKEGIHRVTMWPLGLDASLTPTPAEPRNGAVALKSLAGLPALAALRQGAKALTYPQASEPSAWNPDAWVAADMTLAAIRSLNDSLWHGVIGPAMLDGDRGVPERMGLLREAFSDYQKLALSAIEAILNGSGGESVKSAALFLKTLSATPGQATSPELAEHAAMVVSANREYANRLEARHEARVKGGRVLSKANLDELNAVIEELGSLSGVRERLEALRDKAAAEKPDPEQRAADEEEEKKSAAKAGGSLADLLYQSAVACPVIDVSDLVKGQSP